MFLKIMGSESMPDGDSNKCHDLIEVTEYGVNRSMLANDGTPLDPSMALQGDLFIWYMHDGFRFERRVFSNIYVMNNDGKTIATIVPTPGRPY